MTRAYDDKTSTCGSCSYWSHDKGADGLHPTRLGYCGWWSVPAWVDKHIKKRTDEHTKMREDEGLACWQHTKRDAPMPHDPEREAHEQALERAREGGDRAGKIVRKLLREQWRETDGFVKPRE